MVLLMKELYTKDLYGKLNHPDWQVKAKRPHYVNVPTQGANQCGFYCLKFASDYDGEKLVDTIVDCDVCFCHFETKFSLYRLPFLMHCSVINILSLSFVVFYLQPRVNDWKAEYLFSSVFHKENKITADELPEEIRFLAPGTTALSTQGEALIALFTQ